MLPTPTLFDGSVLFCNQIKTFALSFVCIYFEWWFTWALHILLSHQYEMYIRIIVCKAMWKINPVTSRKEKHKLEASHTLESHPYKDVIKMTRSLFYNQSPHMFIIIFLCERKHLLWCTSTSLGYMHRMLVPILAYDKSN